MTNWYHNSTNLLLLSAALTIFAWILIVGGAYYTYMDAQWNQFVAELNVQVARENVALLDEIIAYKESICKPL